MTFYVENNRSLDRLGCQPRIITDFCDYTFTMPPTELLYIINTLSEHENKGFQKRLYIKIDKFKFVY